MSALSSLILFFLLATSAWAIECSPVDLRNTPPGRAMGPVRNQGLMPWCAAYSMADMLSFKTGECYSGMSLGINFASDAEGGWWNQISNGWNGTNMMTSGHFYNFPRMVRGNSGKPICLEKDLPSTDNGPMRNLDLLRRIGDIRNQVGMFGSCSQEQFNSVKAVFPNLSFREVQLIMATTLTPNIHKYLMRSNCSRNRRYCPQVQPGIYHEFSKIDEQLSTGKIAGIGYSSSVLKNPAPPPNRGGHMSTIVGRRMRNGKCEYLLRNSWGRNCGGYIYPCEEGNIWVPKERLKEATGDVYTLN